MGLIRYGCSKHDAHLWRKTGQRKTNFTSDIHVIKITYLDSTCASYSELPSNIRTSSILTVKSESYTTLRNRKFNFFCLSVLLFYGPTSIQGLWSFFLYLCIFYLYSSFFFFSPFHPAFYFIFMELYLFIYIYIYKYKDLYISLMSSHWRLLLNTSSMRAQCRRYICNVLYIDIKWYIFVYIISKNSTDILVFLSVRWMAGSYELTFLAVSNSLTRALGK